MARLPRILLKTVAAVAGVIALLLISLQLVLNSDFLKNKLVGLAEEFIDAELSLSDVDISLLGHFPKVGVSIDTAILTYPHDRFAQYDPPGRHHEFLDAGRGECVDTLAGFDRFNASVSLIQLLRKRVRISGVSVSGLSVFAHKYDSLTANWNVFSSGKDKDDDDEPFDLSRISVGSLLLDGAPLVYYTDNVNDIYGRLSVGEIALEEARSAPGKNAYDLRIDAAALADVGPLGTFDVPMLLDGSLSYESGRGRMIFRTEGLDGNIAYIPFGINGEAGFGSEGTQLDLNLNINDCDVSRIIDKYAVKFVPVLSDISTDARLDADIEARGTLKDSRIPSVGASLSLTSSDLTYKPMNLSAACEMELEAYLSEDKVLDAEVHSFNLDGDALCAKLEGAIHDAFGQWKADAGIDASASLGAVSAFLPDTLDINAAGDIFLQANASVTKNELKTLKFNKSSLEGRIYSELVGFGMPGDSLSSSAYSPEIKIGVSDGNIVASVDADSVYFEKSGLSANVRDFRNNLLCYAVENHGQNVPHIDFSTKGKSVAVRTDGSRIRLRDVGVQTSLQRRVRPDGERRPRREGMRRRVEVAESDPNDNISVSIDSSVTRTIMQWSPSGSISVGSGAAVIPSVPLRTRLTGLKGSFDERLVNVDTLAIKIGTSDLGLEGKVRGLLRAISGRGMLNVDMNVNSERLNLNELLVAFAKGSEADPRSEDIESEDFVLDSIPEADIMKTDISIIKVPGNVDLALGLKAERVDYAEMGISPLRADITVRDRVVRLTDMSMHSDVGDIELEAYYAAKSKSDVSFGADVHLRDVSSKDIIYMMPNVDSLMPALRHLEGKLGADLSISSQLDTHMNVVWPSLEAILRINGRDLMISDAGNLRKVTKLLLFKNKNIGHIDDMSVDAVLHNGELEIFPFKLAVDRYRCILTGSQDINKKLNYHISITHSPFLIPFGVNIYGYTDNWRYSLGLAKYRNANMPVYTEQLDAIQLNLVESIRNIYNVGVDKARSTARMGGYFMAEMSNYNERKILAQNAELQEASEDDVDSLAFELEMNDEDLEREIEAEVDAAIESCREDFDSLIAGYRATNQNKGILRKIEQLGKDREKNKKK